MNNKNGVKIICIDDEEMLRETIGDYLEDSGFIVYKAENGEEGLKQIEEFKPDVVLLDLHMPGLSGIEVLSIIKSRYPEIAVIIVSGAGEIRFAIRALRNGAWDFITKPIADMQILEHSIGKVLEKIDLLKKNRKYEENLEKLVLEKSAALKESEVKYKGLYYNSGDAFMILGHDGRFLSGNPSIVKMFGYDNEEDFIKISFIELSPECQTDRSKSEEKFKIEIKKAMEKGSNLFDWKYKRIDNSEFYATVMLTKMNISGESVLQATVRDISKQKQTEEELRQAQKMEIVGNLAGGLAHDFNNMLSGIIGTVSLIRHQLNKGREIKKEDLEEYVLMMEHSSGRAAGLVKQLLSLSRKQEFQFINVDLNNIIKQIIKICKTTIDKSISIIPEYMNVPVLVNADPMQIEQVILNLCINGVHAMTTMRKNGEQTGGTLHIALNHIEIDEYFRENHLEAREDKYWIISVRDTGIGINKKVISKIFTPFFTTKKKGIGTGLGLSMVYNIVREHKGFIDVYSEPGLGSTFNIYLPCLDQIDIDNSGEKKEEIIQKGEGTILIVDDESVMRQITKKILEECGYQVICAENGREGVDILKEKKDNITAVLLDMSMPVLSGKSAYIEMKSFYPEVKVLLTSGFKQDTRVREVLKLGVKNFIQKPFTLKSLSISIKKVIES